MQTTGLRKFQNLNHPKNHEYDSEINENWDNYFSGTAYSKDGCLDGVCSTVDLLDQTALPAAPFPGWALRAGCTSKLTSTNKLPN